MKIGLLIISTGKYHIFIDPLIESCRKYFLTNHNITYYLFTDQDRENEKDIAMVKKEHQPWPYPTLYRYKTFCANKKLLIKEDYLFYIDVDMLIASNIEEEILGERVVVIHPGFNGKRGSPEINPNSTAYIANHEKMIYFAGGFNGGTSAEFLRMSEIIDKNIDIDMESGIIAVWHDESHLNRYMIDNKPTKILDPGYCYSECCGKLPYMKKIIALDKNHTEMRG